MLLTGLAPAHEQNTNAGHTNTEQTNANTNANANTRRTNRHSNTNSNMNANTSGDVDVSGNTNTQGNMSAKMAAGLVASDRKFVMAAGMGGMMEVELGRAATTHAASDEVKQF